jgi:hypothetical protein
MDSKLTKTQREVLELMGCGGSSCYRRNSHARSIRTTYNIYIESRPYYARAVSEKTIKKLLELRLVELVDDGNKTLVVLRKDEV